MPRREDALTGAAAVTSPTGRRTRTKKPVEFKPIPAPKGSEGFTSLSFYLPRQWFDSPNYQVFVGGCGVGESKTRKGAEALLLECAIAHCERIAATAEVKANHYRSQAARLRKRGLGAA